MTMSESVEPIVQESTRKPPSGSERRRRHGRQIGVRLDPLEHEAVVMRARTLGLTPADYLRRRGLGSIARMRRASETAGQVNRKLLKQLIGLVGQMGNHTNQMAHWMHVAAHAGEPLPVDVEAVQNLNDTMKTLRAELRQLAGIQDVR